MNRIYCQYINISNIVFFENISEYTADMDFGFCKLISAGILRRLLVIAVYRYMDLP